MVTPGSVAERLIELRGHQSRRSFAEVLGITESTLRNYEQGTSLPNSATLGDICKKLRISLDWLILGEGPKEKDFSEKNKQIDRGIITDVIEVLEQFLIEENAKLPPKAKAEAVYQLYMMAVEEEAEAKKALKIGRLLNSLTQEKAG